MTPRERVVAVLNREKPDRVPKDLSWGLCPAKIQEFHEKTGLDNYEDYFEIDIRNIDFMPTKVKRDFSKYYVGRDGERGFTVDEWGVGVGKSQDESFHFEHIISPLKGEITAEDLAEFPLPDYMEPYRHQNLNARVKEQHKRGLAVGGCMMQTIFEKTWAIRGFEDTLMDMIAEPEMISILFDRIIELRIAQAEIFARAEVDVLMLGDDVGMQTGMLMPTNVWKELLKPRLAKIIDAARKVRKDLPIFYHSCGNPTEIIPELVEIGVTVLNPLQPECIDHTWVKKKFGNKLAFWGGVSAQTNLSFGKPQDVGDEVKRCIETLGANGGYLIGPNHLVEPEVPWENILAFFEAVKGYGEYK